MKNLNQKTIIIAAVVVLALGGVAAVAMTSGKSQTAAPTQTAQKTDTSAEQQPAAELSATETAQAASVPYESAALPTDPLAERSLGNPDAPVKIEEFASLTCSHCAEFHKSTFAEFRKNYIDTGKVFFTFTDFPLNAPALDGSITARCMPPEQYFTFLSFLFETQQQWAFSQDHKAALLQSAKLAGLSEEKFNECMADTKLKEGLVARMQERGQTHGIDSTPSFVINGSTVIRGSVPLAALDQAINDAMKAKESASTEPSAPATPEASTEEPKTTE